MSGLTPAEIVALSKRRDRAIREELIGEWGDPLPRFHHGEPAQGARFAHRIGMCSCRPGEVCYE